jgi:hypothetical protein
MKNIHKINQHIYITDDEEIKEGDWYFDGANLVHKKTKYNDALVDGNKQAKKIILTTDQDLIKDGVQAIDDEFLEWFVKNPSCEEFEIQKEKVILGDVAGTTYIDFNYKIIIPQEEPKQKLNSLVESWQKRQKEYESLAEKHRDSEHTYKKYTYRAQATRDCWKELLKLIEDGKENT